MNFGLGMDSGNASRISVLVQSLLAGWLLARRIGPWGRGQLGVSIAKYAAGAAAAAIVGWLVFELLGGAATDSWTRSGVAPAVVTMAVVGGSMLVTYAGALRLVEPAAFKSASAAVAKGLKGILRK